MTRVKGGTISRARHKKVMKQAKGYFGSKHRLFKSANEQVMHSGKYAYRDRKQKKREFRKLWITRINAACRQNDISYSRFIEGLTKAGVEINRKMLSEIAISNPEYFTELVKVARDGKAGKVTKNENVNSSEVTIASKNAKKSPAKKTATKKVEEKKETVKKAEDKKEDLSSLTLADLKKMAKEAGVKGYSTMKKADLITALK